MNFASTGTESLITLLERGKEEGEGLLEDFGRLVR